LFESHKKYEIYTSGDWYWIFRCGDFWSGRLSSTTMDGSNSAANNTTRAGSAPADRVDQSEQLNTLFACNLEIVLSSGCH